MLGLVTPTPSGARGRLLFGDTRSANTIALLGDSHASHWLGGLDRAGREHGWRIEPYVMGARPVADLRGLIDGAAARMYRGCARFQEAVMRLAAERPGAVILSNADYYMEGDGVGPSLPESVWAEGLRRTYARLTRMGIQVVVMRDVPWAPFDVPSCLSRRAAGLPLAGDRRFEPKRGFMARAQRAQDRAGRGLRVRFIDMNDQVCAPGGARCETERDGMVLYTDDDHISRTFSHSWAPCSANGSRPRSAASPARAEIRRSGSSGTPRLPLLGRRQPQVSSSSLLTVAGHSGAGQQLAARAWTSVYAPRASRLDVARIVEVYDPLERLEVPVVAIGLH